MPLNSVNTNVGAMVALQSLNRTTDELSTTQKRVSTGYRVADAKDDGAAYAVAERVRGEIAAALQVHRFFTRAWNHAANRPEDRGRQPREKPDAAEFREHQCRRHGGAAIAESHRR